MQRIHYTGEWIEAHTATGIPYRYPEQIMPRIENELLDSVVYLYPSEQAAKDGERVGGTGFLVGIRSDRCEELVFHYAVTNSHVIREGESPVVRLNTHDGEKAVIPMAADQWVHHLDGDDVAACPIQLGKHFRYAYVPKETFVTEDHLRMHERYGPGDDVFILGRFVTHEGKQRNLPTARFGNLAMLPWEPIYHRSRGINQESFLVEVRSLSGFSGSPVFIYRMAYGGVRAPSGVWKPRLLGIDWCHIADYKPVLDSTTKEPIPNKRCVEQNSGFMGVVPAWKLAELLDLENLAVLRRAAEQQHVNASAGVVLDDKNDPTS